MNETASLRSKIKTVDTMTVSGIMRPMNERDMMHGNDWNWQNVAGWCLTEKYDGCRSYWDGSKMWTRGGNEIELPADIRDELPDFALDCEIWSGRGGFQDARVAVQHGKWTGREVVMVHDVPGDEPYVDRMKRITDGFRVRVAQITIARNNDHAFDLMKQIQAQGGEGVVARHPLAPYRAGRSNKLLKLKSDPRGCGI